MKAIIIENEISASKLLYTIISDYCPDIEVSGIGVSIKESLKLLTNQKPDIVFLDIELDDGQSFELLDMIDDKKFKIIFTTAYDQYALKAFKYDAVDYLLKPYTPKAVLSAVNRVLERTKTDRAFEKLNDVIDHVSKKNKIALTTAKGIRLCAINEIRNLEADSSYCMVYLINGEKIMVSKPLGEIESLLPTATFYRVHTSHTVNKYYVKSIIHVDGGYIELTDGKTLPLARRRKQEFIDFLK